MLGRRERKREQTKQGLVNAAIDLFIAKGYDETTIDDIVAAADVAKVTFYYYFKSKEEIVLEIKENTADEVLRSAKRLLSEEVSAAEILQVLLSDMARWTEKNWQLLKVFAAQRFSPIPKEANCAMHEKASLMQSFIESIIAHGQRTGEFRKEIDAREVSHFMMMAVMSEQFSWIRDGRKKALLTAKLDHCLDFILHGVIRKKGS